jgi:hypothetical protein
MLGRRGAATAAVALADELVGGSVGATSSSPAKGT